MLKFSWFKRILPERPEMRVEFLTRLVPSDYGIGNRPVKMEMVIGLKLGSKPPITFRHFTLNVGEESSTIMELPDPIASRLQGFCQQHYVEGKDNFDCRSLVFHVMGWRYGAVEDRKDVTLMHKPVRSPEALKSGKPYAVFRTTEPHFPHYMIGIPRSGYSLGVGGHNQPLIIGRNNDLLRAYDGSSIVELRC